MSTEIQRTPREEFRQRYGESLAQGFDHPRRRWVRPDYEVEDINELLYDLQEQRKVAGYPDKDFLDRLYEAMETIDEAVDIRGSYKPEVSYDEAMDEYEAQMGLWEGTW